MVGVTRGGGGVVSVLWSAHPWLVYGPPTSIIVPALSPDLDQSSHELSWGYSSKKTETISCVVGGGDGGIGASAGHIGGGGAGGGDGDGGGGDGGSGERAYGIANLRTTSIGCDLDDDLGLISMMISA